MLGAIFSIQSHVVYGHVGNSAAVFALQRLGLEVWPIHTVQFSSHAGYPGFRGRAFDAAVVDELVDGLRSGRRASPLRSGTDRLCRQGGHRRRDPARCRGGAGGFAGAIYACDPVIGDEGRASMSAPASPSSSATARSASPTSRRPTPSSSNT